MRPGTSQEASTLLDVLIDGFEKNEVMGGFHWRSLPMRNESAAMIKFNALAEEARRWKGQPDRLDESGPRRIAAWPDLEIRQIGRGIMVRARAPSFEWWHDRATWDGDPLGPIYEWLSEERAAP
jgi:hypothetical protein